MASEGKYNIKAVSKMLGIQSGTLRAWERRYSIVQPKRNEAGHRLYTDDQVYILRWLANKVNQGFTISQAVDLAQNGELYKYSAQEDPSNNDQTIRFSEKMLNALLSFEEKHAQEILNQAFCMFHMEKVVIDILGSLLVRIGTLWEEHKITVAHEHFATAFLRTKIGQLLQSFPVDPYLPKIVAFCGLGEQHELGLLMFTLYLRNKGFEVIFLGHGIPKEDLETVIHQISPKIVFVSSTMSVHLNQTIQWIHQMSEKYKSISFGLGGSAIAQLEEGLKKQNQHILIGSSKPEWDEWLQRRLQP